MKKTFFNNSTRGGDLQATTKTKRKFLKTFSFTSLALLMGIAGTMAFAPLGASPSVANASEIETTTEQGLITPKADDPVIYTTESGLEIKWGNAAPNNIKTQLGSGNLSAFPYFTTSDGSTTYTWVIIGRNSDTGVFASAVSSYLFSNWKTSTYSSTTYINKNAYSKRFFDSTYESTTPAGSAINSVVSSKSYVMDFAHNATPKTNDAEIPSGCVLVLANDSITTGANNVTYAYSTSHTNYRFPYYNSTYNTDLKNAMNNYYINKSLGLSSIIDKIQNVTIKTYEYSWESSGDWAWRLASITGYIFPLCASANGSTFRWATYLTAAQFKLSARQWVRGCVTAYNGNYYSKVGNVYHYYGWCNDNGSDVYAAGNNVYGYRPAFVLKIT